MTVSSDVWHERTGAGVKTFSGEVFGSMGNSVRNEALDGPSKLSQHRGLQFEHVWMRSHLIGACLTTNPPHTLLWSWFGRELVLEEFFSMA